MRFFSFIRLLGVGSSYEVNFLLKNENYKWNGIFFVEVKVLTRWSLDCGFDVDFMYSWDLEYPVASLKAFQMLRDTHLCSFYWFKQWNP